MLKAFVLAALLLAAPTTTIRFFDADVHGCYDGDTCTVALRESSTTRAMGQVTTVTVEWPKLKLRLCDINAPELRPRKSRAAALASRNLLIHMIETATVVKVAIPHTDGQPARDNFGRLLGYIYADGENLNEAMVRAGAAKRYNRKCF